MDTDTTPLGILKKPHTTKDLDHLTSKNTHNKHKDHEHHTSPRRTGFIASSNVRRRSTSNLKKKDLPLVEDSPLNEMQALLESEERDEAGGKKLYEQIKHFTFFEAINTQFPGTHFDDFGFIQLCTKLKYQKSLANKVLFQEGDSTDGKVYLVYSGEVSLYKKSLEEPVVEEESLPQTQMKHAKSSSSDFRNSKKGSTTLSENRVQSSNKAVDANSVKFLDENKPLLADKYGKAYKTCKSGDFFGEQTLLDWNPRQYTAITSDFCELLVLTRRDFKFLRENYDEKRKRVSTFLEEFVPQMSNINTWQLLDELICIIDEKKYERGNHIVNEGEASETFYLLVDGTCELIKNVRIDETSNLKDTLVSIKQLLRIAPTYTDPLQICTVQKGTLLGDEVVFGESETYNLSARVSSGFATVFAIEKKNFRQKFPKLVQDELAKLFKAKKKHYAQAIRTSLSKKHPGKEITSSSVSHTTDTIPDKELLNSQVVLAPAKNGELNLKARTGIFRSDKSDADNVFARMMTPDRRRKLLQHSQVEDKNDETNQKSTEIELRDLEKGEASPIKKISLVRHISHMSYSEANTKREERIPEFTKNELRKGLENLKIKISRKHVAQEEPKDSNYVSTSPIPKAKNLLEAPWVQISQENSRDSQYISSSPLLKSRNATERGSSLKKIIFGGVVNTEGPVSNRSLNGRKLMETFTDLAEDAIREGERREQGKYESARNMIHLNRTKGEDRTTSVGRFRKTTRDQGMSMEKEEKTDKTKQIQELQDSQLEMRRLLIGKDINCKEFIMAKKRLNQKFFNSRPKYETEKDGSIGKRLNIMLKPMREKMQARHMFDYVNMNSEVNVSQSVVKKSILNIPSIDSSPVMMMYNCSNGQSCERKKSGRVKYRGSAEVFATEVANESSLNNSSEKIPSALPSSRGKVSAILANDFIKKVKNERKTALLRYKFGALKNSDMSLEEGESICNRLEARKVSPSLKLKIQSIVYLNEGIYTEKTNSSFTDRKLDFYFDRTLKRIERIQ